MLLQNTIYNCNYYEKIKDIDDGSIDLVVTDIPYMISRETNFKDIKNFTKKGGESTYYGMNYEFDDLNMCNINDYVMECCRILKKGGNLIIWSSWQMLGYLEVFIREILGNEMNEPRIGIWIKNNPMPTNIGIKAVNSLEMFICVSKGTNSTFNLVPYYNRLLKGAIEVVKGKLINKEKIRNLKIDIDEAYMIINAKYERLIYIEPKVPDSIRIHPTEKPLKIIKHLVETYSNENDIVFDGLMGSGATAQACKLSHRKYLGFEINRDYYDKAIERINYRDN